MFDFLNRWLGRGIIKRVSLEELLNGITESEEEYEFSVLEQGEVRNISSLVHFLPVEFRENDAIGLFWHGRKRIEIPVSIAIQQPKQRLFTFNPRGFRESKDYMLQLRLKPSSFIIPYQGMNFTPIYELDYPSLPPVPFIIYLTQEQRLVQFIYQNDAPSVSYRTSGKMVQEAEVQYRKLKQTPLLDKMELVIPPDHPQITGTMIVKAPLWTDEEIARLLLYMHDPKNR